MMHTPAVQAARFARIHPFLDWHLCNYPDNGVPRIDLRQKLSFQHTL